ncbi:hypothetical protein ACJMK2_011451 [Sinanodonta woodiana]|uniref:Uncharacterized protein n=1 Tax=Sinanodonta woodiana TaxID=1069815 RepID=A0ABD3V7H0_SINWO
MFGHNKLRRVAKVFLRIATITLLLGAALIGIGVGFPFWYQDSTLNIGIFERCQSGKCTSTFQKNPGIFKTKSTFRSLLIVAVLVTPLLAGLVIGGCAMLCFANIFLCCYPYKKVIDHCKVCIGICVCVCIFVGVAAIMTAVALYPFILLDNNLKPYQVYQKLGYAYYITGAGTIVALAAGVLFILHLFFAVYF